MTLEYEIQEILEMYINLSKVAQWKIFECMVYILTLTLRSDKRQAILTVRRFKNDLIQISIDIIDVLVLKVCAWIRLTKLGLAKSFWIKFCEEEGKSGIP